MYLWKRSTTENFNPFIPEFLEWTPPFLNLDLTTNANTEFQSKIKNRMADSVDPDEIACNELSHLDLHCLHLHRFWSTRLKCLFGLNFKWVKYIILFLMG